ncbi:MAG: YceD family protein [Gemmatimonadales bacterium]
MSHKGLASLSMLQVGIQELAGAPVDVAAELAPEDELFAGLDAHLAGPVRVAGRVQATGEGRFYWHGSIRAAVRTECRRCLATITVPVTAEVGALFSRDGEAEDDPDAYPVAREVTRIDLRPAVREELLLALPGYVVCREDCRGLCPRCGADLNAGPCGCPRTTDPRWQALTAHPKGPAH